MQKGNNIFWVSYSDLMTSLFFVMLVLFTVTIGYLNYKKKITEQELKKVKEIQTSVQQLPEKYFIYQPEHKRFKLNKEIHFRTGDDKIDTNYHKYLKDVGESIDSLIIKINQNPKFKDMKIKYLLIVEGMASKDNYEYNYELSYQRALALYRLWEENGISFNPDYCEVQISGSGTGGIREFAGNDEKRNQQFLIHIIPKIGKISEVELK
jgi:outer membrane protein OmpA-like peptidoglycan-associated protein